MDLGRLAKIILFLSIFSAKLHSSKLKAELEELEGLESVGTKENITLRRDKVLLSDEVASLQSKV